MTPEEKKGVLSRCVLFLRDTAEMLEAGELEGTDPVGVVMFTDAGPLLFIPEEYLKASHVQLEDGITLRGYGAKSDEARS